MALGWIASLTGAGLILAEFGRLAIWRRLSGLALLAALGGAFFSIGQLVAFAGFFPAGPTGVAGFGLVGNRADGAAIALAALFVLAGVATMELAARPPTMCSAFVIALGAVIALFDLGGRAVIALSLAADPDRFGKAFAGFAMMILLYAPVIPYAYLRLRSCSEPLDRLLWRYTLLFGTLVTTIVFLTSMLALAPFVLAARNMQFSLLGHSVITTGIIVVAVFLALAYWKFCGVFLAPSQRLLAYLRQPHGIGMARPELPPTWNSVLARLEELQNVQQQMRAFFDHVPAEMHIRDVSGRIGLIGDYEPEGRHFAPGARIGDLLYDRLPGDHAAVLRAIDQGIAATGQPHVGEGHYNPRDPEEIGLLVNFPIRNAGGQVSSIGSFYLDMTEARAAQAELDDVRSLIQGFFDSVPAAMYVRDADDRFAMINRWGAAAVGLTPEQMIGQSFAPFRALSDAGQAKAVHERVMETGEIVTDEWVYHLPGGDRTGLVTIFPIRNRAGEIDRLGGVIIDVTEQRTMQAELRQTRAILESLVEHAPLPFALLDPHAEDGLRFVMLNPAARRLYGEETAAEILSGDLSCMPVRWPSWEDEVLPLAERVLSERQPQEVETSYLLPGGECRRIVVATFPVFDQSGHIRFIGSTGVDLTDVHTAQEALARAREATHQSEKLAALGQLIAGVAHELNNPLAVVRGRAELLHEQLAGTAQAGSIAKLMAAADRCTRIVKSFLATARQSGPHRTLTQITELIDIALDLTGPGLRSAGIDVQYDLGEGLPDVMADDDQIVQVLINLIINAQHAMDGTEGLRCLTIGAGHDKGGNRVIVQVSDTGPGVPAPLHSRIFDPFFSTKDVGEGTGLGLAVCKGIVDSHGGDLSFLPGRGGGACFTISLPVNGAEASAPGELAEVAAPKPAKGRVLIVDDEPDVGELLADCLASLELDCTVVTCAREALDWLAREHCSLIFADVRMPDVDGMQFYQEIQARWPERTQQLVFVSGDVLHREFGNITEASGRPLIEKPFNFTLVREVAVAVLAEGDAA